MTLEYHEAMKNFWRNLALLAAITILFSSCPIFVEKPEVLAFNTDLRVLRGNWSTTVQDKLNPTATKTADLNLVATYIDASSYLVSGSFQITGEAALVVQGLVKGGTSQSFTRTTPLPPFNLAALFLSSTIVQPATQVLLVCPYPIKTENGQWQYQASLESVTADHPPFGFCYWGSPDAQQIVLVRKP